MKPLTIAWMTVIIGTTPAWVWREDPDTGRQVILRKIDRSITLNPGEGLIVPTWTTLAMLDADYIRWRQTHGTLIVPLPDVPRLDARMLTDLLIDEAAR